MTNALAEQAYNKERSGQASVDTGGFFMSTRRLNLFLRKSGGILLAVGGIFLVVKTLPVYLWPLALGTLLIWIGWQLYIYDRYFW